MEEARRLDRIVRAAEAVRQSDAAVRAARAAFRAEIEAARKDGVTLSAIARALGISRQRVYQLLK
jgi:DNA invertase Pin-like site-specific DNA recombinase